MKVIKLKENDLRKYIAKIIKENQSTENYMFSVSYTHLTLPTNREV